MVTLNESDIIKKQRVVFNMGKVICQNCGYENKDKMKFCTNCGTKLEKETLSLKKEENENRFCEECGHPIELGQIFCENCGNRVNHEEEIPEEVEEEQELEESKVEEEESWKDEEHEVEVSEETEGESELKEEESSFVDDEENENVEQKSNEMDENEVRFCKNCGKELKSTQDFCPGCGMKVEEKSDDNEELNQEFTDFEEHEETKKETKKGKRKEETEAETSIFCIECGSKLNTNQDFCPSCGAKVNDNDFVLEDHLDIPSEELEEESIESEDEVEEVHEIDEVEEEIEVTEESEEGNYLEEEKIGLEEEQSYCTECGKKIKKGQDFCIHCGTKIGETKKTELIDSEEEKSRKKKFLILILFLVIAACLVLGWIFLKPGKKIGKENEQKEEMVSVPSVIDKSQKDAIKILEELSFEVKIEEQETEDNDKVGFVFEQEPVDKKVKKNSEVIIRVYISVEKVEMIPIVGESLEDAEQKLRELGVETKVIEQASDEVEAGKVISQEVSEGENVSKGSTVTITVSTGKEEKKEEESKPVNKEETKTPKPTAKSTPTPTSKTTPKPTAKATPKPTSKATPTPTPKATAKPNWSSWTTSLPSNVNSSKYDIETKTQYRSRSKETTTSTSSSLSGWTKYDTKSEPVYSGNKTITVPWDEYSSFKSNTNYQIISEVVIERDISYGYCKSNSTNKYNSAPQVSHICPEGTRYVTMQQTSTTLLDTSIINSYISKNLYDGTGSHLVLVTAMEPFKYKITYKEKSGENHTYYFYRWCSWGSWQDNQISSNDSTEVSTRTMYRYRAK